MHWTIFYTKTDIAKILSALNDKENKFIKLWEVVIATNQSRLYVQQTVQNTLRSSNTS